MPAEIPKTQHGHETKLVTACSTGASSHVPRRMLLKNHTVRGSPEPAQPCAPRSPKRRYIGDLRSAKWRGRASVVRDRATTRPVVFCEELPTGAQRRISAATNTRPAEHPEIGAVAATLQVAGALPRRPCLVKHRDCGWSGGCGSSASRTARDRTQRGQITGGGILASYRHFCPPVARSSSRGA